MKSSNKAIQDRKAGNDIKNIVSNFATVTILLKFLQTKATNIFAKQKNFRGPSGKLEGELVVSK